MEAEINQYQAHPDLAVSLDDLHRRKKVNV
jgi:hypothetical protein